MKLLWLYQTVVMPGISAAPTCICGHINQNDVLLRKGPKALLWLHTCKCVCIAEVDRVILLNLFTAFSRWYISIFVYGDLDSCITKHVIMKDANTRGSCKFTFCLMIVYHRCKYNHKDPLASEKLLQYPNRAKWDPTYICYYNVVKLSPNL